MKIFFIIFLIFTMSLSSMDNPRGRDLGGKLKDMEKNSGGSDNFWVFMLIEIMLSAPEVFFGKSSNFYYTEFPYQNHEGLYSKKGKKSWHLNSNIFMSQDYSNVNAINFEIDYFVSRLWSFKVKHNRYSESFRFEENILNFTQIYARYNRVRLEKVNFEWGMGLLNMSGEETNYGLGFDFGLEWFVFKPVSFEIDYSIGNIDDRLFHDVDLRLNLYRDRIKGFLGYKYLELGNTNLNNLLIGIGYNF